MLRAVTMLCLGLTSVGGWQMTALPVPSGHAHCASSQASARQAVAPRMCGYDHLSSEFQARRRAPTPILPPLIAALSPSQRLANQRTGTEFGEPRSLLQQHKAESAWVLLFNAGQKNEGVYAHTPMPVARLPAYYPSRLTARTGSASAGTRCRADRRPRWAAARTCSRSRSTRRRAASG